MSAVQATLTALVAFGPLGLDTAGPVWLVIVLAVGNAVLGMALGLFLSAFAQTEFQAVQFMPAFVLPQFLQCGLLLPRDQMPRALELVSDVLPLSYAVDAMQAVSRDADPAVAGDLLLVAAFTAGALVLGALTLRRQTD